MAQRVVSPLDRPPFKVVADRFGYRPGFVRLLKHYFVHGEIDFSEAVPEGKTERRGVAAEVRSKIREWRERRFSAGEIAELLSDDGVDLSVRTVERVLREEGFQRLPRRIRIRLGLTVKGARIPDRSEAVCLEDLDGRSFDSPAAGVFLFTPFLA